MTQKRDWKGIAGQLEDKARRVLDGGYGPDTELPESTSFDVREFDREFLKSAGIEQD